METKLNKKDILEDYTPEITTIARGAGFGFVGIVIGTGLRYILQIIITRNLGAELFGLFFLGFAIFKVAGIIAEMGLPNGIIRYVSIFQGSKDKSRVKGIITLSIKLALIAGVTIGIIIFFLSEIISIRLFHEPELIPVLKYFAIIIPFTTITTVLVFSIQGFKIIKYKIFIRELFEPILRIVLVATIFILGWKLFGVIFSYLFSTILGTIIAFYYLKKVFPEIIKKNIVPIYESKKLLQFSWPLLFAYFTGFLILWTDTLMVGYFRTSYDVGIYSVAQRTALIEGLVISAFNSIFAPIISDLYNRKELIKLKTLFKMVAKWIFTFSFPIFLLIILLAKPILSVFGEEFINGASCLIILSFSWLVNFGVGPVGIMIPMIGKPKLKLINSTSVLLINIILNLILIPKFGILGAAIATATAISLISIINLFEIYFIMRIHPYRIDFLKPLISGLVSLLILFLLINFVFEIYNKFILIGITSLIFFGIYSLILYLLGIGKDDKIILKKFKEKINPK